ncbi:hypothetical protein CYMTET_4120 [Cymbomonas tetramitiformis]|uniref:Uncharacterized protein n=1 Tax=Cymbomonas tetramitiformis TaxID=36881 RepID=A0AAE0H1T4_9CHLO|nr:hypothetical protein CYMTET_4120 [Cymbomonas tetramitiformis]
MAKSADVDWDRVDKQKMFYTGVGLFSSVMGCLFPLTVLKTRIMVQEDASPGFQGVLKSARRIWAEEGAAGFYRGFPTVVVGTIPARVVCSPSSPPAPRLQLWSSSSLDAHSRARWYVHARSYAP